MSVSENKSFTLIELLIVIGILAVLVAAIVITLNPAQLLQEARDSKRQQDLSALNQALNTITTLDQSLFMGTSSLVYTSLPDATTTCANWNLPSLPAGWQYYCVATSSLQNTNGTGWIPVNFKTTGVVSLSSLPTDPINASSSNLYYTYVSGGSFELNGILESTKYRSNPSLSKPNLPGVLSYGSNQALSPLYNTSGLVGYWNFDNNVSDQSGNNNNGTWYGTSTTRYVGGKVGSGAGTFNGTNDYVQILNSSSLNPIDGVTISAWVDTSIQAMSAILYKNDSGKYLWLYDNWCNPGCSGSRLYLNDGITSFDNFSTVLPVLNKWRLVVGAYDKTKSGIYSDGVLLISNLRTLNPIDIPYPFYIKPNGLIDDVRIYNRALSASEVQALYSATK